LDPASEVNFDIAADGGAAGSDYSQLVSPGPIALGGAAVGVRVRRPKETCATLPPGRVYTLATATGGLTGTFGNAPEGGLVPINFRESCGAVSQYLRVAYDYATGTVTGTVVAGPTSTTMLTSSVGAPETNQGVRLTATVTASSGGPEGNVEFRNGANAIPNCGFQPVSAGVATCQTSFAAASSPEHLTAAFVPRAGVNLQGSTSGPLSLTVTPGATTTHLQISNTSPAIGQSVTYTATVAAPSNPGAAIPTGTVEFRDDGLPIGSCASRPLTGPPAPVSAGCQISYPSGGSHGISARYVGDASFAGSLTPEQTLTVPAAPTTPTGNQQVAGSNTTHGGVSLVGTTISVPGSLKGSVKLHCTAPGGCRGTLTLTARVSSKGRHGKRRTRTLNLGTAPFTLSAGQTLSVKIELSPALHALLAAGHGRLAASLTLIEEASGQEAEQTKKVRLLQQATGGRRKKRK
ncbi:MAG TPA: Ig-like domain-containing protein, partial [Solirubrobacteraceae bacterium]|nr:Ig-like domain-containing protein [Solirubrobacteraceae bacterium]